MRRGVTALVATIFSGCRTHSTPPAPEPSADAGPRSALGPPPSAPVPLRGMAWIPPGALVAGSPPDARPRIADQEMRGEQVILKGFYVDLYPYPNEEGAIPRTNVTQAEAGELCQAQGKRLCTELEWERACKGPENRAYEYGDRYQASRCETGQSPKLVPSGLHAGCVSDYGVHDLHGGVWEWTSSPWGRGDSTGLVAVRGGNAVAGEVSGRCANAAQRRPTDQDSLLGFRCCGGPTNAAEVSLRVARGRNLELRDRLDKKLATELARVLPDEARAELGNSGEFRFDRLWIWRPTGNEELQVAGGCAGLGTRPACGVLIARTVLDRVVPLSWVSSGHWVPIVQGDVDARDLWLFGGDQLGQFRCLLGYRFGDILVGSRERRVPKPDKEKKKKRKH
jgi:formylglycine-generating enzyme